MQMKLDYIVKYEEFQQWSLYDIKSNEEVDDLYKSTKAVWRQGAGFVALLVLIQNGILFGESLFGRLGSQVYFGRVAAILILPVCIGLYGVYRSFREKATAKEGAREGVAAFYEKNEGSKSQWELPVQLEITDNGIKHEKADVSIFVPPAAIKEFEIDADLFYLKYGVLGHTFIIPYRAFETVEQMDLFSKQVYKWLSEAKIADSPTTT